jgi:hypothetical protein
MESRREDWHVDGPDDASHRGGVDRVRDGALADLFVVFLYVW